MLVASSVRRTAKSRQRRVCWGGTRFTRRMVRGHRPLGAEPVSESQPIGRRYDEGGGRSAIGVAQATELTLNGRSLVCVEANPTVSSRDMQVQVPVVLLIAQVRQHLAAPVPLDDASCHALGDLD